MKRIHLIALLLALMLICPAYAEEAAPTEAAGTAEAAPAEAGETASEAEEIVDLAAENEALRARVAELEAQVAELESRLSEQEAAEALAEPAEGYAADSEVITFEGGSVPLSDALEKYRERAAYYDEIGIDESTYAESLKQDVLDNLAEDAVLALKAQEMGVYELTDEDVANAEADAREIYETNVQYYLSYFYEDGLSDAEIRERTEAYLSGEGVSYEYVLADTLSSLWRDRLFDAVTEDVSITDEDIRAMYDSGVSSAMELYGEDPTMFEYDFSYGDTIYYVPEGYRRVDYILLPFTSEESVAANDLMNELSVTDEDGSYVLQAELDEICDAVAARYADVIERAGAGEDLEALAGEYSLNDFASVPVREDSETLSEEFLEAAMALSEGEVSAPVPCEYGLWLMKYISDIEPGEVPYEELHDVIAESALDNAKQEVYFDTVDQWLKEANIVTHPEMLD